MEKIKKIEVSEFNLNETSKWHGSYKVKDEEGKVCFKLSSPPSGCGSYIISEYQYTDRELLKKTLKHLLNLINKGEYNIFTSSDGNYIRSADVGMVMTTLGRSFYSTLLPVFEELGFEKVKEYPNPRHNDELQCLLVWTKK
jgi:hypothetical protein